MCKSVYTRYHQRALQLLPGPEAEFCLMEILLLFERVSSLNLHDSTFADLYNLKSRNIERSHKSFIFPVEHPNTINHPQLFRSPETAYLSLCLQLPTKKRLDFSFLLKLKLHCSFHIFGRR